MARLDSRKSKFTIDRKGSGLKYYSLYNNKRWQMFSAHWRKENPLCVKCGADCSPGTGRGTVDHIIPVSAAESRQEAKELMYLQGNHQTLCNKCNTRKKDGR